MRTLARWVAAAAVTTGLLMAAAAAPQLTSAAQESAAQEGTAEVAPAMLVLDASGSMAERARGGVVKMTAARRAVGAVLGSLPADAQLGLTVYGSSAGAAANEKSAGCKDVKVVHPIGALDRRGRAGIIRAVGAAKPRGFTPIGRALQTADAALPKTGPRSIVLVSDGEDTCAPPKPCDVAKALAKRGVELRIHAIGFQVGPAARAQLTCIAQATGGTYTDAPGAADLGPVLTRVTGQALRNYQAAGRPVVGSTEAAAAPTLGPGAHLDTLDAEARQYYAVDLAAGATAYFSATAIYPRGLAGYQALHIRLEGPDGDDCGAEDNAVSSGAAEGEPLTAALIWTGAGSTTGCSQPGRYTFEVWRNSRGTERVPVELFVELEPPAAEPGPTAATAAVRFAPTSARPRAVTGGGSFGAAATLAGAGAYTDTLQPGEFVFYRVRLNWGQGVAVRVRYADGARQTANVKAALYQPARKQIAAATATYAGRALTLPASGAFATLPVRYDNRRSADEQQQTQSLAGWHYIAVKLGSSTTAAPGGGAVPVRLDMSIGGRAEPGPQYAAANAANTPAATTATPDPTEPATQTTGDEGPQRFVALGLVAVAALAAAVAAGVLVRRLRPNNSGRRPN